MINGLPSSAIDNLVKVAFIGKRDNLGNAMITYPPCWEGSNGTSLFFTVAPNQIFLDFIDFEYTKTTD